MRKQFSFMDYPVQDRHRNYGDESNPIQSDKYKLNNKASWTDLRVQQIKKKYDTPSHRKYNENLISGQGFYKSDEKCMRISRMTGENKKNSREAMQNSQNNFSARRTQRVKTQVEYAEYSKDKYNQRNQYNQPFMKRFKTSNEGQNQYQEYKKGEQFQRNQLQYRKKEVKPIFDEGEVILFQKIQEMKESLGRDRRIVGPIKNIMVKNRDQNQLQWKDFGQRGTCEPRVENIDKINNKIRRILQCLNQNSNNNQQTVQEKPSYLCHKYDRSNISSNYGGNYMLDGLSRVNNKENIDQPRNQLESTKIIGRQEIMYLADRQQNIKQPVYSKTRAFENWNNQYLQNKENKDIRSRSCVGSFPIKKYTRKAISPNNKIDNQITQIQNKIEYLQEEKRKLKIDFKPFCYETSQTKSNHYSVSYRQQNQLNQYSCKPPLPNNNFKIKLEESFYKNSDNEEKKSLLLKFQPHNTTLQRVSQSVEASKSNSYRAIAEDAITIEDNNKAELLNNYDNQQLRKQAGEGIELRKKRLQQLSKTKNIHCIQTIRLVTELCTQIKLDEEYRNSKIWFSELHQKQKWNELAKQLENQGLNFSRKQMMTEFAITDDQNNPFYSFREDQENFITLINNYCLCEKNWREKIKGQFESSSLFGKEMLIEKLDLDCKGFVIVEDLVRFLNCQSGEFLRNRDVLLIFRRLVNQYLKPIHECKLQTKKIRQLLENKNSNI